MNPYLVIAAGVATLVLAVGSFSFGVKYEKGQVARTEALIADVREQAQLGAADAIAKQVPVQKIIQQKLETQVRENTVYRDCHNSPESVRLLNDALTNRRPEPTGSGELPGADPAH